METICIVGGGLGGLALAHALVRECPEKKVVVLERDESSVARSQGIIIGVQQGGIDALVRLGGAPIVTALEGLLQEQGPKDLLILNRAESTLLRGRDWLEINLPGMPRCGLVDRAVLRTVLATSLPVGVIQWNSRVSSIEADEAGVWVECMDGSRIRAHLVIGADGYRSQVRALRCPSLAPEELGVWQTGGLFDCPESKDESSLFKSARKSLVRMNGDKGLSVLMFITTAPSTPDSPPVAPRCLWSLSLPSPIASELGLTTATDGALLRDQVAQLIAANFNSPTTAEAVRRTAVEDFLPGAEMNSVNTDLLKKPSPLNVPGPGWRVMLLGDALHKTTTQAGLGATAAFQDAVTILEMVRSARGGITEVDVQKCNSKMWKNAAFVVNMSVGNTKRLHAVPGAVAATLIPCLMRFASAVFFMTYFGRKGLSQLKRLSPC